MVCQFPELDCQLWEVSFSKVVYCSIEVVVTSKPCKRGTNSLPVALLGHISFSQR